MDRPMGPRQRDHRNAAYESIFGRPSASHHVPGQPPGVAGVGGGGVYGVPPHSHPQHAPAAHQQHYFPTHGHSVNQQQQHQPYGAQLDRRTSHSSMRTTATYANTSPVPSTSSPYTRHPQAQGSPQAVNQHQAPSYASSYTHPPQSFAPHHIQQTASYPPSHHPGGTTSSAVVAGAAPHLPRPQQAPSLAGSGSSSVRPRSIGHAPGTIRPAPDAEEPPDPSLEALQRTGLTPAQAYQAQVYSNQHLQQQRQRPRQVNGNGNGSAAAPMGPRSNHSAHHHHHLQQQQQQPHQHSHERRSLPVQHEMPHLGINFETSDGRLDIDFDSVEGSSPGTVDTTPSSGDNGDGLGGVSGGNEWLGTGGGGADSSTELSWVRRSKPDSIRSRLSGASGFSPIYEQEQEQHLYHQPQHQQSAGPFTNSHVSSAHHHHSSRSHHPSLQLETAVFPSTQTPPLAPGTTATATSSGYSSPSSTMVELASVSTPAFMSGRRSSESSKTLPGLPSTGPSPAAITAAAAAYRRDRGTQDRTRSMSSTIASPTTHRPTSAPMIDHGRHRPPIPSLPGPGGAVGGGQVGGRESPGASIRPTPRRGPVVYPALLSRVALAFKERVQLSDRVKDGLTYKEAFDGREAVSRIACIIKTTDRNLALLYGRALDAQKFFHAVTYDHRLRDSSNDLYQFRTKVPSPFTSDATIDAGDDERGSQRTSTTRHGELTTKGSPNLSSAEGSGKEGSRSSSPSPPDSVASPTVASTTGGQGSMLMAGAGGSMDDVPLPSGVFTLLTDCYSPTCTRDQLCYSIACPRRLEQQARLNMKPQPGLKKEISKESLGELVEPGTLWIHSVPQEVVNSVSDTEKRRQEAINEVIYTERDFVRDLEYLRDLWVKPLQESEIILPHRRTDFLEQVFWNVNDIIAVNTRLRDALNKRQKSYAVVEQIGDILLESVPHFSPFVSYGAHQLYGKYEFEKEKSANPSFAQFVEEVERRPESRKLELNGYLTKPTTRLARYPLLLEAVLKHTSEDNPDKVALPKAIALVRGFLKSVNEETGKAENRFNLLQLDSQLVLRQGEDEVIKLRDEGRELVFKGPLKKRGNAQSESAELLAFLFDNSLLLVKQKTRTEQYKVYRPPIPIDLLVVSAPDEFASTITVAPHPVARNNNARQGRTLVRNTPHAPIIPTKDSKGGGFPITFVHLGRKSYSITLWASTYANQRKWVEQIQKQQEKLRDKSYIFETVTVCEGFFVGLNRVNCAAPFGHGRQVIYGTDDGVYISNLWEPGREPVKVLALQDVSQVDILEDYGLLIVLSERQVITFPFDALDPMDPMSGLKRAKRIASHITFFKAGVCLGKTLVCVVKASPLSSTIKTLEPIDQNIRGRAKPTFRKLLQGGNDTLRVFREFYIPVQSSSIHFLKTKLCVGCTNGFEIVDLESLDTQGLLDPADTSLDFARRQDGLKPVAIYRIDNEFLLCYDEFAFYVNKTGWRSRKNFTVYWEGSPTGFALHYPYVLAFEAMFVEVWNVETGVKAQTIQGNNLRLLFADTPPSTTNTANPQFFINTNNSTNNANNPYQQPPPPPPHQPYRHNSQPNPYNENQYSDGGYQSHGRSSLQQNGYAGSVHQGYYNQPATPGRLRDEILLLSDDRVMRVQLVNPS